GFESVAVRHQKSLRFRKHCWMASRGAWTAAIANAQAERKGDGQNQRVVPACALLYAHIYPQSWPVQCLILRSGLLAASRRMATSALAAILRDAAQARGSSG